MYPPIINNNAAILVSGKITGRDDACATQENETAYPSLPHTVRVVLVGRSAWLC